MAFKRLIRSKEKMWGGVLAGIGNYLEIDPTIVRVVYAILTALSAVFPGLLVYIIMWIIIPDEQITQV
jgi:phage shock protein C